MPPSLPSPLMTMVATPEKKQPPAAGHAPPAAATAAPSSSSPSRPRVSFAAASDKRRDAPTATTTATRSLPSASSSSLTPAAAGVAVPSASAVAPPPLMTEGSADHFARSVALMSVAHVARGVGFDAVQRSASEALVELLARYVQRVGAAAKDVAEHAGRTQPRASDVATVLDELLPLPVELPDLVKALETAKRPFPREIPAFAVRKREHPASATQREATQIGRREALPAHIPSFLPPLPNRHTYRFERRAVIDRERDQKRTRLELLAQKSHVQQSLHGLQTAFGEPVAAMAPPHSWNPLQGATPNQASENPFVAPPVVPDRLDHMASNNNNKTVVAKQAVFGEPQRAFAPAVTRGLPHKRNVVDSSASALPKLSGNQELGKEEKILTGTFHDGDSE